MPWPISNGQKEHRTVGVWDRDHDPCFGPGEKKSRKAGAMAKWIVSKLAILPTRALTQLK